MTLLGLSDCEDYFKATDKTDEFLVLWKVPAADAGEPRVAQVTAPCYFAGVIILVLLMALIALKPDVFELPAESDPLIEGAWLKGPEPGEELGGADDETWL